MTQHEYVFIAISIILGLALTRLLHSAAGLIRVHTRVTFHWATALWSVVVMLFILQLWWVGWELRTVSDWTIVDFFVLVIGSIFIYGAAELALPTEDYDISDNSELVFLEHSRSFGRLSTLSMLGYFSHRTVREHHDVWSFTSDFFRIPNDRGRRDAIDCLQAYLVSVAAGRLRWLRGPDSLSDRVTTANIM